MNSSNMIRIETTIPNFDKLFYGNLRFSVTFGSTILIEGSAGSGKTTLALQLACDFVRTNGLTLSGDTDELKKWENAKRLSVYIHLEEEMERLCEKIRVFDLLDTEEQKSIKDVDGLGDITEVNRLIGFISGDELDSQRQRWRETYTESRDIENPLPYEPHLRAKRACEEGIKPESDYDLMSIVVTNVLEKAVGVGPVVIFIVIDNLNSLDTFEILEEEEVWTIRQKYAYLRSYIRHLASKLNDKPNTDILPLVCLFVADEPREEDRSPKNQIEYVSDAYIRLGVDDIGPHKYSARVIEVVKASNLAHIRGKQHFAIQKGRGLNIYLSPPAMLGFLRHHGKFTTTEVLAINKGHTACDEIDAKLTYLNGRCGLIENSTTLIRGPVGSAKSILALHFLDGKPEGEAGLYLSLSDRTGMLLNIGRRFQLAHFIGDHVTCDDGEANLTRFADGTQIVLLQLSPTYMVSGCMFSTLEFICERIENELNLRLSRLVFDNLSQFGSWLPNVQLSELFPALSEWLQVNRITSVFLHSTPGAPNNDIPVRNEVFENILKIEYERISHPESPRQLFDLTIDRANGSQHIGEMVNLEILYSGTVAELKTRAPDMARE